MWTFLRQSNSIQLSCKLPQALLMEMRKWKIQFESESWSWKSCSRNLLKVIFSHCSGFLSVSHTTKDRNMAPTLFTLMKMCWFVSLARQAGADCYSDTYAGVCQDNVLCRQTCIQEGNSGGHCGPFRKTSVCYCKGCESTTGKMEKAICSKIKITKRPLSQIKIFSRYPNFKMTLLSDRMSYCEDYH
jgi:Gamma-thionin family